MHNQEIKELTKSLTKIHITEYLNKNTCDIKDCTTIFINTYQKILKTLIEHQIFNNSIDEFAKEIALILVTSYVKRTSYNIEELVQTFINSYKYALKELEKEQSKNSTIILPKHNSNENEGLILEPSSDVQSEDLFPISLSDDVSKSEPEYPQKDSTFPRTSKRKKKEKLPKGLVYYKGI